MNSNINYNSTVFRTFWQKVVDNDMTDIDVRYDAPLKVNQKELKALKNTQTSKARETDEET